MTKRIHLDTPLKKSPKVSILIPTFNRANYLRIAVDSAIKQTYSNIEILILDDCSTDDTINIQQTYSNIENITFIRNTKNIGFIKNWNKAISLSSGKYIKIIGDDDLLDNSCIAEQVNILNGHSDVGIVCCNYFIIDGEGSIKNNNDPYRLFDKDMKENGIDFITNYLSGKRPVGWPASVLFRRRDFDRAGGFDTNAGVAADIDMWCRILRDKNFYYLDKKLAYNRQFPDNLSKRMSKSGKEYFLAETVRYLETIKA